MMAGSMEPEKDVALAAAIAECDAAWQRLWDADCRYAGDHSVDIRAARDDFNSAHAALRAVCPHPRVEVATGYGVPVCVVCGEESQ